MYYPKVNRGISFTKPGIYSFCLILLIGLIAISSGINALYVFLSAGLGGFIVSGLLSEWAIKYWQLDSISGAAADANAVFSVSFKIRNDSSWFSIFQMRTHFFAAMPRFQLIAKPLQSLGAAGIPALSPKEIYTTQALLSGLKRGVYDHLYTVQLTTFPFGILEKFKVSRVKTHLVIAPQVDQSLRLSMTASMASSLLRPDEPIDFYSHRQHQPGDSLRHIDWRRSAGLPPRLWVTKQYRSPSSDQVITITMPWPMLVASVDEAAYERLLIHARTLMSVLDDHAKPYELDLGEGVVAAGSEPCRAALALIPAFTRRQEGHGLRVSNAAKRRGSGTELQITAEGTIAGFSASASSAGALPS